MDDGRHMGIKNMLMQNMSYIHNLCGLIWYLSAHKGAATMLLLPIRLPFRSGRNISIDEIRFRVFIFLKGGANNAG